MFLSQSSKKLFKLGADAHYDVADLLLYISDIIADRGSIRSDLMQIPKIKSLQPDEQNKVAEEIYDRFEKLLCPTHYTREQLRAMVAARFDIHRIRMPFMVVFFSESEQGVQKLQYRASELTAKLLQIIGKKPLEKFINEQTAESILRGITLDSSGLLDFSLPEERFLKLPTPWLKLFEKSLLLLVSALETLLFETSKTEKSALLFKPEAQKLFVTLGLTDLTKEGVVRDLEKVLVAKSGRTFPVVVTASTLKSKEGDILGAVIAAKDLSEIRRLEIEKRTATLNLLEDLKREKRSVERKVEERTRELKEKAREIQDAKEKMETLIESIGDGVMAIDPNGKIMLWNKAAQEITGWTKAETLDKNFHDILKLVRETDQQDNSGFVQTVIETKTAQAMGNHTLLVRKDGKTVPVEDSASPVLDAGRILQGVIVVFRDVTEERQIDKAKEEFVSVASHQLRTPLTAIKGYTEMLIDQDIGTLNAKQREYLEGIKIGNDRMIDLITALLNVSRIDLGIFTVEPQSIDFSEIIESILTELAAQVQTKGLRIEKTYEKNIPPINADPKLLRIVFQNILTNAIKYTPREGTISVRIQQENLHVAISITDSGCGIPEDAQQKIFTKFFRADNARQLDPNGNGLGLYIIKAIVEGSDGKIWFESPASAQATAGKKETKGTTFHISFPLEGMKKREGVRMLQ